MPSVRDGFIARFSEEQANKIELAAVGHQNTNHDKRGDDPFKWAVLICIGFECVSCKEYREYHGITISQEDFLGWCKTDGHLDTHNGDVDYMSLFCGVYRDYMPEMLNEPK